MHIGHIGAIHDVTTLAVSDSQGPGPVMRTVLVVTVLGVALMAWFLLRGYGKDK
ncbi:MAG: hypothetical protein HOY69_30875 [Streptomyces sp.]|nr:hypothetical protein [Streptomyces sp.]